MQQSLDQVLRFRWDKVDDAPEAYTVDLFKLVQQTSISIIGAPLRIVWKGRNDRNTVPLFNQVLTQTCRERRDRGRFRRIVDTDDQQAHMLTLLSLSQHLGQSSFDLILVLVSIVPINRSAQTVREPHLGFPTKQSLSQRIIGH